MKDWMVLGVALILGIVGALGGGMLARELWGQPCDCEDMRCPPAEMGSRDAGGLQGTGLLILGPGDSAVCNPFVSPLVP